MKIFFLCKRPCATDEKISYRLEENICNSQIQHRTCIRNMKRPLKAEQREINNPVRKRAKALNRHCTKKDPQMGNRRVKRCSTASATRGRPIRHSGTARHVTAGAGEDQRRLTSRTSLEGMQNRVATAGHRWAGSTAGRTSTPTADYVA